MIPKIIHYCWLSNDPIPQNLQECMKSWKEKLPDYEFVLWNFDRFDINSSRWVSQAFENKKYAFAADYIRLYAVYNLGGFYMDMDIEVLKSFNDLLDKRLALAHEDDEGGIEAGCFGAEKNNPIIKKCLDYYTDRSFVKSDGSFDTLPLPRIMARFCVDVNLDINDKYYFTCKSFKTGIITTKPYSYTIHHFAGSWLSDEDKAISQFVQRMNSKKCGQLWKNISVYLFALYTRLKKRGFLQTVTYYINRKTK